MLVFHRSTQVIGKYHLPLITSGGFFKKIKYFCVKIYYCWRIISLIRKRQLSHLFQLTKNISLSLPRNCSSFHSRCLWFLYEFFTKMIFHKLPGGKNLLNFLCPITLFSKLWSTFGNKDLIFNSNMNLLFLIKHQQCPSVN